MKKAAEAAEALGEAPPEKGAHPLPPALPAQYIGIWERGDGTLQRHNERHPSGAARFTAERESLGDRAFWAVRDENDGFGKAQDAIIQRWVEAHGFIAYVMQWREKLDGEARSR
jgi:hypothetical protein